MIHILLFLLPIAQSASPSCSLTPTTISSSCVSELYSVALPAISVLFVLMIIQYLTNIVGKIRSAVLK